MSIVVAAPTIAAPQSGASRQGPEWVNFANRRNVWLLGRGGQSGGRAYSAKLVRSMIEGPTRAGQNGRKPNPLNPRTSRPIVHRVTRNQSSARSSLHLITAVSPGLPPSSSARNAR